jgi:hypothetical protein
MMNCLPQLRLFELVQGLLWLMLCYLVIQQASQLALAAVADRRRDCPAQLAAALGSDIQQKECSASVAET